MNRLEHELGQGGFDAWSMTGPASRRSERICAASLLTLGLVLLAACGLRAATTPKEKAWNILDSGVAEKNAIKRADAVEALGLLPRDARARTMAEKALGDDNPRVRAAAAIALGDMRSTRSIPKLVEALSDKDPVVVLSAAHSLLLMHDHRAYDVYYAVLTGQRKAGRGLIAEQRAKLDDPKKLAVFGVETGLGFVPFGGIGVSAYKLITKNGSDSIRAAAAEVLAKDPDPESRTALIDAVSDHSYPVRIAALKAIAERGDSRLLKTIEPAMDDEKDTVQFVAAAALIHLAEGSKRAKTETDEPPKNN
ncbi:putative PBS lyase HEAT domain protein repeat-containing protein [Acidobacteriia bacterium SbA2]|nr:putative PBS lyase HEAT domain protein repeat-containing protein [Acidobacteriia bacterium SbA2]